MQDNDRPQEARLVFPPDLIGAREAAALLGVDRSTLVRRIEAGKIRPLAQLDGPRGTYVFDRADILAATQEDKP